MARKCGYCSKRFNTYKQYVAHYRSAHRKKPKEETKPWAKFRKPGKKRRR